MVTHGHLEGGYISGRFEELGGGSYLALYYMHIVQPSLQLQ